MATIKGISRQKSARKHVSKRKFRTKCRIKSLASKLLQIRLMAVLEINLCIRLYTLIAICYASNQSQSHIEINVTDR